MHIITLTLNPAFDLHCHAPQFAAERENAVCLLSRDAGGKGINISRALHSNGLPSQALVVTGSENSADFCRLLDEYGIAYISMPQEGRIRENITLHTAGQRETRISFAGFSADSSLLDRVAELLLPQADDDLILTLTGSLPQGIVAQDMQPLLAALRMRGVRVVIDSRSFSLADLSEAKPFLIKPNEEEIALYYKQPVHTLSDAAEAAAALQAQGIANVLLTLGAQGGALATPRGCFTAASPAIKPASTIGAGDSSIAGFLAAMWEGKGDADCLRTAIAYGSAACLRPGTAPPLPADIARLLEEI